VELIYYTDNLRSERNSIVTVGTFDGVHLGHRAVLDYLIDTARQKDASSTLVTFDPHPRVVVSGVSIPLLSTIDERSRLCEQWGLDRFIVIPFTTAFANLSAEQFVENVLIESVGMTEIVVGHDHSFGKGGRGDEALLRSLSTANNFEVNSIPARVISESAVSSSRIRSLVVDSGHVRDANNLLGYRYGFDATVVRGSARGRELGFPTANLELLNPDKIVPLIGVYAVTVFLDDSKEPLNGMMNIGVRPTFGESELTLEVHIIDSSTSDALYDRRLRVEFVERLRGERQFAGVDALIAQLKVDKKRCTELFAG
jgi:riboflavin kinase/FMN adenylyltransferase